MIVQLYLSYNKMRERTSLLDSFCIVHFLFGYALYKFNFPLLFAIFIDIISQLVIRTKTGESIVKQIFGDKNIKDENLLNRCCDTFFIIFGWFVAYLITGSAITRDPGSLTKPTKFSTTR